MALGIQSGSAFGRGFDAGGLSGIFKAWVVNDYNVHGPKWYIWEDKSGNATDPYIVVTDQAAPTPNSKAKFVKWQTITLTGQQIRLDYYLYWDNVSHAGIGTWHTAFLGTVDNGTFAYYFRGGNELLCLMTQIATTLYYSFVDEWEGIWDGVFDFTEPETASGVLANPMYVITNPSGYIGTVASPGAAGVIPITGLVPANLDANGFIYISIVFVSGTTYFINIYKDSARTQLIAHTSNFTNSTTGNHALIADNSSGVGGNISTAITVSAATNIFCQMNRITVNSGQGANFTVGNYYFVTDFSALTTRIVWVKVDGVAGDVLTVSYVNSSWTPVAGALISPYPHRWVGFSSHISSGSPPSANLLNCIPYSKIQSNTAFNGINGSPITSDALLNLLVRVNPNVRGRYPAMRGWIVDQSGSGASNAGYGRWKNVYTTAVGGLAVMQFRRTVNSKDYICFFLSGGAANCILDTESLV